MAHDPPAAPRRRPRVVLVIVAALLLLTAIIWVTGGLKARAGGPTSVKPGRAVDQGLFRVEVLDARAGNLKLHEYDPAANILVVRMRVTGLGGESYGIGSFVHGIAAEPKPGTYAEADLMRSEGEINGDQTSTIHPRLPITVQVVWVLGNSAAPAKVTVALRTWEYTQSFTNDTFDWVVTGQSPVTAEVTVPVRQGATS